MKPECLQAIKNAAGREVSPEEADSIETYIRSSVRDLALKDRTAFASMTPFDRMTEAAKMAKERMLQDVVRAHEASLVEAGRRAAVQAKIDAVQPGKVGQTAALLRMVQDNFDGLEAKTGAIARNFLRQITGFNEAAGGKLMGAFLDPSQHLDIMRAMYGEKASPEAQAAAKSLRQVGDSLVDRTQRAGIPLNALEDYHTPQVMEPAKVAGVKPEEFVNDALAHADLSVFNHADGSSATQDEIREILRKSYTTIATDGASRRAEGGGSNNGSSLVGANKNAPRRLFWKDADSWYAMMQKYGRSTNLYDLTGSHIRGMSKDIAMAETFGRDATGTFQHLLDTAHTNDVDATAGSKGAQNDLVSLKNKTQRTFDTIAHPQMLGNEAWARFAANVRGFLGSSQLGSLVGAFPDAAGMKMASELNGLPAMRAFRYAMEGLTANKEGMDFLRKTGIWMEGFQHTSERTSMDDFSNNWGTWLNEGTHKMMGLNAFDRGLVSGNGLVVMDTVGQFTRKFATLAEADGESALLKKAGLNEDHWAVWRAADLDKGPDGQHQLLTPDAIYKIPDAKLDPVIEKRLADRSETFKREIVKRDAQLAKLAGGKEVVPGLYSFDANTPEGVRAQEIRDAFQAKFDNLLTEERANAKDEAAETLLQLTQGQIQFGGRGASPSSAADKVAMGLDRFPAGTIPGELWRFAMQFKAVPLGIFRAHWEASKDLPGMSSSNVMGSRQAYLAKMVAYSTLMGAVTVELKALINGQNPRNMNLDTKEGRAFWPEALMAGGGFGMYGDLFVNGQTAQGSGAESLMGPGIGAAWNLRKELLTAEKEATEGESTHPYALSGLRWVRKNATPLGNLWYTKTAFNRLVYDQLQDQLAPGSSDKQRRRMEARGASYWWAPGTTSPQSAPDLSTAVADH